MYALYFAGKNKEFYLYVQITNVKQDLVKSVW